MNPVTSTMETLKQGVFDDLRRHLLDALAHDLRSPITSIYMWIEILERKRDEVTLARGLDVIARSARSQARMLDEATELAAVFVPSPYMDRAPLDFAAIVEDEVASVQARSDEGAELNLERGDDDFQMVGDTGRLRQLVRSLIGNARRSAKKLDLRLSASPKFIDLRVLDAGAPEGESQILKLLETPPATGGVDKPVRMTTLQMAAARRNAELHEGSLRLLAASAESPFVGIGLRLPR